MNIIETDHLNFRYGSKQILSEVSLAVPENTVYGFIGPNGAGKSTTIRILLGLSRVEFNKVRVFGQDIRSHRIEILKRVGALIESPSCYEHLSGYSNLEVFQKVLGLKKSRIDEVLEIIGLKKESRKKVREYSLGMKQRLGIGQALMGDPSLLILDEPLNGLDPIGIREMREFVTGLVSQSGTTVFVSSHDLSELEKICHSVGILEGGKLVFQGTMHELTRDLSQIVTMKTSDNRRAEEIIGKMNFKIISASDRFNVQIADKADDVMQILKALVQTDIVVEYLNVGNEHLEEQFFAIINQENGNSKTL